MRYLPRSHWGSYPRPITGCCPRCCASSVRAPGVRLQLTEAMSDVQIEELVAGRIDAGLVISPLPPRYAASLEYVPVAREALMVAMPVSESFPEDTAVDLRRLAHASLVVFPRHLAPGLYDIMDCYGAAGLTPRIGQETIQMQTIVSLVSAGMGVALVPESLRHLRRTGVVYRPLLDVAPVVETGLVWRTEEVSPALAGFIEIVRTRAATL